MHQQAYRDSDVKSYYMAASVVAVGIVSIVLGRIQFFDEGVGVVVVVVVCLCVCVCVCVCVCGGGVEDKKGTITL